VTDNGLGRLTDTCVANGVWGGDPATGARADGPGGRSVAPSLKLWGMTQLTAKFHQGHDLPPGIIQGTPDSKALQAGHSRAGAPSGTHWSVRTRSE
jgi:hypothetical protein